MTNWQRYLGVSIGVGLPMAWLSMAGAGPARAQGALKPVAAQVRVPYSSEQKGSCNDRSCFVTFPEVPAGKLLIIEHFSAFARPTSSAAIFDFAELITNDTEDPTVGVRSHFAMTLIGIGGPNGTVVTNTWSANQPVLAFARAGSSPRVTLATRAGGANDFSFVTLSGYTIDVP